MRSGLCYFAARSCLSDCILSQTLAVFQSLSRKRKRWNFDTGLSEKGIESSDLPCNPANESK